MPAGHPGDMFIHRMAEELAAKLGINHPAKTWNELRLAASPSKVTKS
jgi:hypothetical protein